MNSLPRILRHLGMSGRQLGRRFPPTTLAAIEQAIRDSERLHGGQICFALEGALSASALFAGEPARERALEVFSLLRVWDTEHNNGVLIYLLLADRDVEIVADRGIHARVDPQEWEAACREMEAAFRDGRFEAGAIGGIQAVARLLVRHFPAPAAPSRNELPDRPVVL